MTGVALAQPAPPAMVTGEPETVYSDAQREKDDSAARHFMQEYLAPEILIEGQYARWKQKVCPKVWGLAPVAGWFVEHRIKEIADKIGAPVDHDDDCARPNVLVVVTPQPQASLDSIADKAPVLVAYQEIKRLTIKHPIQSWYVSLIHDYNGKVVADVELPDGTPPSFAANDSRLRSGLSVEMHMALIIIDADQVTGQPLGALADYAALAGLSQTVQRGACQVAPTIANLMLKGCAAENESSALTDFDLAMLNGLYHAPMEPERLQRQFIVRAMKAELAKEHGGATPP
jgi:hypothetical protein